MARLRYNGLTATLGAPLTAADTTITLSAPLTHAAGTVPTLGAGDEIPLTILGPTGAPAELVTLTGYTSGELTGTISRGQESTTAVAHTPGMRVVHALTVGDFGTADGVATLDEAGLLPEAQVPTRLTEAGLSASYATVATPATFTAMPEVHASGSETPIYGRTFTDGKTVGAWNVVHDGTAGDLFHFTTGPNTDTARTVTDAVTTNGSTTIISATAAFTTGAVGVGQGTDVGKRVSGPGIPTNATITAVNSANSVTISAPATATAAGVTVQIGVGNPNGGVIAIGIDNGGQGIILVNKHKGVGLVIRQRAEVASASAFGMQVTQESTVAEAAAFRLDASKATKPVVKFDTYGGTPAADTPLVEFRANTVGASNLAGRVMADTGALVWFRDFQSKAADGSGTARLYAADHIATNPTEAYLTAKTTSSTGLFVRRNSSGSAGASQFFFQWENETGAADRFKLKVSRGAAQPGAEVYSTMIEVRANAGTGNKGQMGFFGVTPANQPAAIASPTADAASLKTAVDAIRTALTTLGLTA